ncbi:patatin-like phospholipase family protein [Oceanihabitans sediminis]|uniref:Patatin n=1 Tax=Oceanihabitans sediminis TaxID=1812012 RepID=A0A368P7J0_9FLAO|nr:patatin-like phospholipase family protein [Oceanihabitans sediminis]MDX1278505.1 patatin-like phospholipase family protein [Oceanihabitans sediminis]MDX1772525.1 patatin-like phospholipase family protein [Oceanihabitans sediminis]RBP34174.1 NTE family protein [Oceanihabitans sediminis]RCU57865.1 patatin [Oceanihabitans sediminis]
MNIGLVLSGGGARGVAHIGAIKALEEVGIFPTHISGTSAGAIVGGMYAAGMPWEEILHFFKTVPIFRTNNFAFSKPGFIDSEKLAAEFKVCFPDNSFESLKKPLYVTATNVETGKLRIFSSGEVIKPILASASFPGVFTPVKIKNAHYIDGGVLNNFPTEPLRKKCETLIGVYVNPLTPVKAKDIKYSYSVLKRAYDIMSASESLAKFSDCNMVISPDEIMHYGTFSMKNMDEIFELGYISTMDKLKNNIFNISRSKK